MMTSDRLADFDFQASASQQGRNFEELAVGFLVFYGWTIDARHQQVSGVEIDIIATHPAGVQWWIECKGSHRGNVPGARRGDTVKKAVGVAWYLSTVTDRCPYMLLTSHLPKPDSVGGRLLSKALEAGLFSSVRSLGLDDMSTDDLVDDEAAS